MTRPATGAVVTGGGGGIGRALARRLAAGGARVVVNDIDAAAAEAVAAEIGGLAVPADVATRDGVTGLVAAARDYLGEIDLYCSNAGVAVAGDEGGAAAEADWQRSWDVNVMAHVRAAEQLLPGWLARGQGRLVVTASAAGLLTMLGTAPYSVTKHGAVGYAEWLAATYGHRGLKVHCLCPQGVRTAMLSGSGRPATWCCGTRPSSRKWWPRRSGPRWRRTGSWSCPTLWSRATTRRGPLTPTSGCGV